MTEAEKQAIERINNFKSIKVLYGKIYAMHTEQLEQLQKDIETAIKLIEKQQAEIEKLRNNNKNILRKLRNRVKEVKNLTKYSLYKKEFATLNKHIEKRDKIIDLMAEQLKTPVNSKEWVIEYYTKEVEEKCGI